MTDPILPAWSEPFVEGRRDGLDRVRPIGLVDRELAFGGSDGDGVTVAIIDSGVDGTHPAVGSRLVASVKVEMGDDGPSDLVRHPRHAIQTITGTSSRVTKVAMVSPPICA